MKIFINIKYGVCSPKDAIKHIDQIVKQLSLCANIQTYIYREVKRVVITNLDNDEQCLDVWRALKAELRNCCCIHPTAITVE